MQAGCSFTISGTQGHVVMDKVNAFCPPFAGATKSGKPVGTHYGGWLPWPRLRVSEEEGGWFIAQRQGRPRWGDPLAQYGLPGTQRRREKRPLHIRFGGDATSGEGALQFVRQIGLPDLPPFHELADTFDAWRDTPGWSDLQRTVWANLRGHGYEWGWLELCLTNPGVLHHAPVMVFGPWVQLVAGLQSSLNCLAEGLATQIAPDLMADLFDRRAELAKAPVQIEAPPATEVQLREASHDVARAMIALLEWAEPHWAAYRGPGGELRLCLLPALLSHLARVLDQDVFKLGAMGGTINTHQGIWRWLRDIGLSKLMQGGALAPPYAGAFAERDQTEVPASAWPDCALLTQLLLKFSLSEHQIRQWKQSPDLVSPRSYLNHAIYVLTTFAAWDNPDMALPTRKPYVSLRQAMLGMSSRDAFGGWWVRCGDLEQCGRRLFAPRDGVWYHQEGNCSAARRSREAKRRARGKG